MKNIFLGLTLLTTLSLIANEETLNATVAQNDSKKGQNNKGQNNNVEVRRGPQQKGREVVQEQKPVRYEYHNRMAVFTPWHIAYERIETDAIYWGIEGWVVPSLNERAKVDLIGEAEFRMGYNLFWNGRDHFTPFAGVGYFQDIKREVDHWSVWFGNAWDDKKHHKVHKGGVVYGTVGFLYEHEFSNTFTLGLNLKGLAGGGVGGEHHERSRWGSPVFGLDFAVPLTFRFGHKKHWDLRLEPFDIYLHGHQRGHDHHHHKGHRNHNFFGGRSTIGYRF